MWADWQGARACLVQGALQCHIDDAEARACSLAALWGLSCVPSSCGPMWQDEHGARAALLKAARIDDPKLRKLRHHALAALQNLATEAANKVSMWQDENGLRAVLIAAASSADPVFLRARLCAIRTLQSLTAEPANRPHMWKDYDGARRVLLASAELTEPEHRKVRSCALGAISNLATEPPAAQEGSTNDAGSAPAPAPRRSSFAAFDDPVFSSDSREARAKALHAALASVGTGSFFDAPPLSPKAIPESKMDKVTALRAALHSTRLSTD